jgi:hypothetical protein
MDDVTQQNTASAEELASIRATFKTHADRRPTSAEQRVIDQKATC